MAEFVVQLDGQTVRFESNLHHLDALKSVADKIERGELSDPHAKAINEKYQSGKGLSHQEWSWLHFYATTPEIQKQPKPALNPRTTRADKPPAAKKKRSSREPKSKQPEIKIGNAIKQTKISNKQPKKRRNKAEDIAAFAMLQKLAADGQLNSPREQEIASSKLNQLTIIERKEMHKIIADYVERSVSHETKIKPTHTPKEPKQRPRVKSIQSDNDKEATREVHLKLKNLAATGKITSPLAHRLAEINFDALKPAQRKTVNGLVVQYEKDLEYKKSIKPTGKKNGKDYSGMGENLTEYGGGPRPGLSPDEAWKKKNRRRQKYDSR